jgi:serine/threonine protein kinase
MAPADSRGVCPKLEDLAAFNSGNLPVQALELIGQHLALCPSCMSLLNSAAEDEANEVRAFRRALKESTSNPFATDPEYLRMEQRIHALLAKHPLPAPPGAATPPPSSLGQYQLVEKIGQGGMGAVYRALHTRLKKPVAIKILPADRKLDYRAVARFNREMEAVGQLDHRHIVRATDAGEAEGVHFLVMELIDGLDLARLIRLRGRLTIADACELVRQAALGLQCAHEQALVHRDVKPSNLLVSVSGEIKVLDLGLALLCHNRLASGELTATGQVMGTADYMAPEQWEASHAVDIRADIYSLGCTLYTLLTGRPPFAGPQYGSAPRKMAAHLHEPAPPVHLQRPDVPAALEQFLAHMLAKQPADRPGTPAEVAGGLHPFCHGADLAALVRDVMALPQPVAGAEHPTTASDSTPGHPGRTPPSTAVPKTPRAPQQRRLVLTVAVLGVVLLAATVALRPWTWLSEEPSPNLPEPGTGPAMPPDRAGWQNLLTKAPAQRLWLPTVNDRLDFDKDKELLWVTCTRACLIRLGETEAPGYKLQLGFRQMPMVGYVGVYFGGRAVPEPTLFRCQLITLDLIKPNADQPFTLHRHLGTTPQGPGISLHLSKSGVAKTMLMDVPRDGEQLLEILVHHRLMSVRWNGQLCPELVTTLATDRAAAADNRGEFGIYCERNTTIISTARYQAVQ